MTLNAGAGVLESSGFVIAAGVLRSFRKASLVRVQAEV